MSNDENKFQPIFQILHIKSAWFLLELAMALVTTIGMRFLQVWSQWAWPLLLRRPRVHLKWDWRCWGRRTVAWWLLIISYRLYVWAFVSSKRVSLVLPLLYFFAKEIKRFQEIAFLLRDQGIRSLLNYTVVPLPTLSLGYYCVPKKDSLAQNSLGLGLFYVVKMSCSISK